MAASLKRRHTAFEKARIKARDAVYNVMAPRADIPFSQCLAAAPEAIAAQWRAACEALDSIEREAIDQGRAWRGNIGGFYWY